MSTRPATPHASAARWRYWWLAALLMAAGVGVGAAVVLRRGPDAAPPNPDLAGGDPAVVAALESAQDRVRRTPGDSDAWGRLGMVFTAHGFQAEAEECFRHAQRLDPAEPRWFYFRAQNLAFLDPPAVVPELRQALRLWGDRQAAPRLRLAQELLTQGRYDEAEAEFAAVLAKDPKNPQAHLGMAQIDRERDDTVSALAHLENCLADPGTVKPARLARAECLQSLGDRDAAAREGRLARPLPDVPLMSDPFAEEIQALQVGRKAALGRAYSLLAQGRSGEGGALLLETVQNYPDAPDAWLALGRYYLFRAEFARADLALRSALAKQPGLAEGWFYLGGTLLEQGKPAEAEGHFRHAIELRPGYPEAYRNLGRALVAQGKRAEAIEAYRQAIRGDAAFVGAHLELAELLALEDRAAEAQRHLELVLRLDPDNKKAGQLLEASRGATRPDPRP